MATSKVRYINTGRYIKSTENGSVGGRIIIPYDGFRSCTLKKSREFSLPCITIFMVLDCIVIATASNERYSDDFCFITIAISYC